MWKLLRCLAPAALLALGAGAASADSSKSYEIVDGGIPASLTGKPGDPAAGEEAMLNRKLGNCLACHAVTKLKNHPFHGEIGPALDGVADRYSEAQLRLILVNAKQVFDGTMMPAFYKSEGFTRVMDSFAGKSILTAKQVEDVLSYLSTFKEH
ncbi:sulfur-oxidizing protein SoxX [Rhodobium orientis]|uniref:Sulfur oxidation c-type cytochrome SoxX n=1 Tax=Rhodobium orientis TaxID=34017 RepID=A0A327JR57_9HYPH|nr:sulfur oxidation c-type cytochrome SoxX [Rhodobium orientis]MBB4302251.1 sulfur-oxidizing protein SoxX [Rhodobium orientis]MBK5948962.1 sulfur oxidation c-type cytochrome SoxX [Rhodobium orientis]RAI28959.1 sulfur oxidation c-type cytochrome SoxX [Rhodobium orientis]